MIRAKAIDHLVLTVSDVDETCRFYNHVLGMEPVTFSSAPEAAWRWIDPILAACEDGRQEAQGYTSGTWGPSASIALIERDGRTWHESV